MASKAANSETREIRVMGLHSTPFKNSALWDTIAARGEPRFRPLAQVVRRTHEGSENRSMAARVCHHCKQRIEEGEEHDCWTTTETALTKHLAEDLRDAWERLRETAASFGDQRIYASHKSIMFSRQSCYFFVRPKTKFLELCVFLGRE